MKFEVGDWVLFTQKQNKYPMKIDISNIDEVTSNGNFSYTKNIANNLLIKWQPQIGEWCWHKEKGLVKVIEHLDTNSYLCKLPFTFNSTDVVSSSELEPYIGTLPTFIKD